MSIDAFSATLGVLWHVVRGHRVQWRTHVDIPVCSGDVVCQSCSAVLWCRAIDPRAHHVLF
jgi:hypothetical protein